MIEKSIMQSPPAAETIVDGKRYLYFGGSSYLGLHGHPEVLTAATEAVNAYGIHTASSRTAFGNSPPVLEAERQVATFFGTEAAYHFVSGYIGNSILVQVLMDTFDAVFVDAAAHYSVKEAARLTRLSVYTFLSRSVDDLDRCLQDNLETGQRPLVMTDGVFPHGWVAPLDAYVDVLRAYDGATLIVDDAHGVGVLGNEGRGTLEHLGLWSPAVNSLSEDGVRLYMCATLSKAMGGYGGFIPGSKTFLAHVRAASHHYEGISSLPTPIAAASARAITLQLASPDMRTRLHENIRKVRSGLRELGLKVADLPTAAIGVTVGDAANMERLHEDLKQAGILVPYMRSYSDIGPEGMLRITVFSTHTREMIDRLLDALSRRLA